MLKFLAKKKNPPTIVDNLFLWCLLSWLVIILMALL